MLTELRHIIAFFFSITIALVVVTNLVNFKNNQIYIPDSTHDYLLCINKNWLCLDVGIANGWWVHIKDFILEKIHNLERKEILLN